MFSMGKPPKVEANRLEEARAKSTKTKGIFIAIILIMFNEPVYARSSPQYQYYLEMEDDDVQLLSDVLHPTPKAAPTRIPFQAILKIICTSLALLSLIYGIYLIFDYAIFVLFLILYLRDVILSHFDCQPYSDSHDVDRVYKQFLKQAQSAIYPFSLIEEYSQQMLQIIQNLISLNLFHLIHLDSRTLENFDAILVSQDQSILLRQLNIIFKKKMLYLNTQRNNCLVCRMRNQDYQAFQAAIEKMEVNLAKLQIECEKQNRSLKEGLQQGIRFQLLKYMKCLEGMNGSEESLKNFEIEFLALTGLHQNCVEMLESKKKEEVRRVSRELERHDYEEKAGEEEEEGKEKATNKFVVYNEESDEDEMVVPRRKQEKENVLLVELEMRVRERQRDYEYEYKKKRREKREKKKEEEVQKIGSLALFQELRQRSDQFFNK